MGGVSDYERSHIDAVTRASTVRSIERGVGLFVMPGSEQSDRVHEVAVLPALRKNRLNVREIAVAFDDTVVLEDVCRWVKTAELIVLDASGLNPSVLYVLGLCHGLKRSPILVAHVHARELPFNLAATGCFYYDTTVDSLMTLRQELTRRIRVFLASARPFNSD